MEKVREEVKRQLKRDLKESTTSEFQFSEAQQFMGSSDIEKFNKIFGSDLKYSPVLTKIDLGKGYAIDMFYDSEEYNFYIISSTTLGARLITTRLLEKGIDSVKEDTYFYTTSYPETAYCYVKVLQIFEEYETGESILNEMLKVVEDRNGTNFSPKNWENLLPKMREQFIEYFREYPEEAEPLSPEFFRAVGYSAKEVAPKKFGL